MWVICPFAMSVLLSAVQRSVAADFDTWEQDFRRTGTFARPARGPFRLLGERRTAIAAFVVAISEAELGEGTRCRTRHERGRCERDETACLEQVTQGVAETLGRRFVARTGSLG